MQILYSDYILMQGNPPCTVSAGIEEGEAFISDQINIVSVLPSIVTVVAGCTRFGECRSIPVCGELSGNSPTQREPLKISIGPREVVCE